MNIFRKKKYIYYTKLISGNEYELVGPFDTRIEAVMHKHEGLLLPGQEILDDNTRFLTSENKNWSRKRFQRSGGIFMQKESL